MRKTLVAIALGTALLIQLVSEATAKGSGIGKRSEQLGAPVIWHVDLTLE